MKPKLLLSLLTLMVVFPLSVQAKSPNIVVFLVDDMGWGDLGCYGNEIIKSPNLDAFAKEGVRFTQCYSACGVCSPSRASILTGRTPYRNGVWRWIPGGHVTHLRESEITLPELLKEKGYDTCHVGKWHLNGHFNSDKQPQPDDHGYNHWMATQNNASPNHKNPTNFVLNGEEMGPLQGFSAPLVATEGVRWLREVRDQEKPFLLSVWTHEPHLPIESAEEFMKPYAHIEDEGIRQHHGNITQLDHAFGIVMKGLDDLGLREETIVFFTSDNGPEGKVRRGRTQGSTGGLRGRKRDSHEGGIRVAGLVRWPGRIEPGTVSTTPVIGSDIFSTVLDIVGLPLPADRTIDGVSMVPAFRGESLERPVPLFWRTHIAPRESRAALRVGDWKLVADEDHEKFQLYEIEKDWQETRDLAEARPEKLEEMKNVFFEVWSGIEKEGPREWWEQEPPRQRAPGQPKKVPALAPGKDQSGDWTVVRGGTVREGGLGYVLDATGGEAIALARLDPPVTGKVRFEVEYRAAVDGKTRNALLCFGDKPEHQVLIKAGTMIGMNRHGIFQGGWGQLSSGVSVPGAFAPDDTFTAKVELDLSRHTAVLTVGETKVESPLPKDLKEISHYGLYAKGTKSSFSKIEVVR
jgi:arylsulfatase A